jgi:AraC family transcriptional regulator of arabinose operon
MHISDGFIGERFLTVPLPVIERMEANAITRQLYVCAIGHFPKAKYHYIVRPEGCDEHILIYCVEGKGVVIVDDIAHPMKSGQAIVIPRGSSHIYYSSENNPWTIYWVHFRGVLSNRIAEKLEKPLSIDITETSRQDERNRLFDELYNILDVGATMDDFEYGTMLFMHYISTFYHLEAFRKFSRLAQGKTTSHSDTIVRKAIHFMNENLERRMTMTELSQFCGYSSSYLFRKFKKETGKAPIDLFIQMKINRACFLLLHTDMTVSQIAFKLAFSESQFFARTFKKVMGVSATDFRKSARR